MSTTGLQSIDSLDQIELLLTSIIFASSVQHAGIIIEWTRPKANTGSWFMVHESWITEICLADGNPMFDIYGNPPNHPVLMRLPAPTQVRNEFSKVIRVSKRCEKLLWNLPIRSSGQNTKAKSAILCPFEMRTPLE